jgi:hypothetical protein|tara:strand:- start:2053 stop:2241 length:189 start_codon:yes stop_codon:yes gene_type:complete
MHELERLEKRIDAVMTARDYCKPGSWGDNYWGGVLAYLLRQLNNYTNKPGIISSKETIKNLN